MSETLIKRHWYDGWFYSLFIDTNSSRIRNKIFNFMEKDKTVLDVGCGTGGFALKIAKCSRYVVGVDISEKMIRVANKRKKRWQLQNVNFIHANANQLTSFLDRKFDYAVLSFFIHEISSEDRMAVLTEAKQCADQLIIFDYKIPQPKNILAMGIQLIEFFAGWDHYQNFLDFNQQGGMNPLLDSLGFEILSERLNRSGVFRIVKVR